MQVRQVMTTDARFIPAGTTLERVAATMHELDCGFLPVGNAEGKRFQGVVTDRDIVVRGVAAGRDPQRTPVEDVISNEVLYCFEDDDIESAAESMQQKQVYRLVVLDGPKSKKFSGVISLGDILQHEQGNLATKTAAAITHAA